MNNERETYRVSITHNTNWLLPFRGPEVDGSIVAAGHEVDVVEQRDAVDASVVTPEFFDFRKISGMRSSPETLSLLSALRKSESKVA